MSRITPISWKEFEKVLFHVGCEFTREKGDHRVYWKKGLIRPVVIPREKQLPVFIIRNNLRILGITPDEYLSLLQDM